MRLTLGLTGMDPATESALQAAFQAANGRLGSRWELAPDTDADYVIVDMDSMYGPMSWLRLHAAGKSVIALTAAQRTQADFRLGQPFDANSVGNLLREIGTQAGVAFEEPKPAAPAPTLAPTPTPAPAAVAPAAPVAPAPAPAAPVAPAPVAAPPPVAPAPAAAVPVAAPPVVAPPVAAPAPATASSNDSLAEWLAGDRLRGRVRLRGVEEGLLIDLDQRVYHGPAGLKPLSRHFEGKVDSSAFAPVDAATWDSESARLGASMPLSRLVWFGNLLAGKGVLAPEHDAQRRYLMVKWPQTEREFPKHFRIATVMMKGPSLIGEIAEASGVSVAEVADFINANLATGFAEPEKEPEPADPGKAGGSLFGRLRGR